MFNFNNVQWLKKILKNNLISAIKLWHQPLLLKLKQKNHHTEVFPTSGVAFKEPLTQNKNLEKWKIQD